MKTITSLALAALGLAVPSAALAGANKTWVSGAGADSGTCQFAAPCRSFQYALTQTSAGGEIDVKDAGGYGTVAIDKAISIVAADGVLATISVPANGIGITVQAGNGSLVVLSGLTIDGHNLQGTGIALYSTAVVTKCNLRNLASGVSVVKSSVYATIADNNFTGSSAGILANTGVIYLKNNLFSSEAYGVNATNFAKIFTAGDNAFFNTIPFSSGTTPISSPTE